MKIFFPFRYFKHSTLFCCFYYVIISGSAFNGFAEQIEDVVNVKKMLSAKLDSVEMEKQIRKRKGEPLGDLENESKKIHDSIAVLRTQLSGTEEVKSKKALDGKSTIISFLQSLCKPTHIFDWIIIIVGVIAVVSGIILIMGVIHTIFRRSSQKSRQSERISQKHSHTGQISKGSSEILPSVSSAASDKENRDIISLRKRMRKDIERIQRFNNGTSPFSQSDDSGERLKEQDDKNTIRDSIIRAAKEGLDVQEISRKYHVSVDQVALILRVANEGQSKNQ